MTYESGTTATSAADQPKDNRFHAILKAGFTAFDRSVQEQQAWLAQIRHQCTVTEWRQILWEVVTKTPYQPASHPNLRFNNYHQVAQQVIFELLSSSFVWQAQQLWEALQQDVSPQDFNLTRSDIVNILNEAIGKLEKKRNNQNLQRIRERLFDLDPFNVMNGLKLIQDCIRSKDEFSASLFCHTLANRIKEQYSTSLAEQVLQQETLKTCCDLVDEQYFDGFFELVEAYIDLSPKSSQPKLYAVVSQIARYHQPDRVELYQDRWQLKDLVKVASVRDFVRTINAIIPVGHGLRAVAESCSDKQAIWLNLNAEAAMFLGQAGDFRQMQEILNLVLDYWPVDKLKSMIHESEDDPGTFRFSAEMDDPEGTVLLLLFRIMYLMNYSIDDRQLIRSYHRILGSSYSFFLHTGSPGLAQSRDDLLDSIDPSKSSTRPLKVGYLSTTFQRHSVGFLSYQAISYHDPNQVQVYLYSFFDHSEDDIHAQFERVAHQFVKFGNASVTEMVKAIRQDQLDILVFLDVMTVPLGCDVLAFRVAPIQMCWLGGDSPGLPEVDYFLVDPHILPAEADADYTEKLIRLPVFTAVESFAVDGWDYEAFRHGLKIDPEAVIFWTAAIGYKRHPDWIECQLEILRQVPQSVLLIKGLSDMETLSQAYLQRATELGVADRIRFLAWADTPEKHRAQVGVADLVLDTFPYTGSTHTAEALWRGIPVLTCVGDHYYSRMSYTQLMAIGQMEACIAHSAAEFVEKGVRLGLDRSLRQQLHQRLQDTRKSSPLWNARYFIRSVETAYRKVVAGEEIRGQRMRPHEDPSEDLATPRDWLQAGCRQYQAGLSTSSPQQRHSAWESALWHWRRGLEAEPRYLLCWLNSIWLIDQLGDKGVALRESLELLEQMRVIPQSQWQGPDQLSKEDLIWSSESVEQVSGSWVDQCYFLLVFWIGEQGFVYRPSTLIYWRQALDLVPQDLSLRLTVALNLLHNHQMEGLYHLQRILDMDPDHASAKLALEIMQFYLWRQLSRSWSNGHDQPPALPTCQVHYEGYELTLEPRLSSVVTVVLLTQQRWFEGEIEFCRRVLQPGMTMLDVGANVGVYTFLAARCVGPTGRIVSFEPDPECCRCLQETVTHNDLSNYVTVISAAVGSRSSEAILQRDRSSAFNRVLTQRGGNSRGSDQTLTVDQICLDDWWQGVGCCKVDLIKVDVEGMELDVFRGGDALLRQALPLIIFEHNTVEAANNQAVLASIRELEGYLADLGYRFYGYRRHLDVLREIQPQKQQSLNLIAAHSKHLDWLAELNMI